MGLFKKTKKKVNEDFVCGTASFLIKDVCDEVCNNFCVYKDSKGNFGLCDYQRKNGCCPLDRL